MIPVLAVDDTPANLQALRMVLRDLPIELDCVESGNAGLSLLLEKQYAIALIDVQMPGMNGFEMAELMRSHSETESVPIIFITAGSAENAFVFRGYEVGAVDYMIKPYEPRILVSKVKVFLDLFQARKQLHVALEQQKCTAELLEEANDDLSRFAAIAAHDLRSPLNKAQRLLSMLRLKFGEQITDKKAVASFDKVERSLDQMADLVAALYDLYSMTNREVLSHKALLKNIIEDATGMLSEQIESSGATVEYDGVLTLRCDAALMRQVFQNLIGNALKYAREGVPPVIRIEAREDSTEGAIVIDIADNGEGFDAKAGTSLFAPFARLSDTQDREGLGIGLATVRKIVERHSGKISATGVLGEGATFTIRLPLGTPESG